LLGFATISFSHVAMDLLQICYEKSWLCCNKFVVNFL